MFVEGAFEWDSQLASIPVSTSLQGYFQSWRYFEEVKGEILFAIEQSWAVPDESRDPHISVQVRRGDYLEPQVRAVHGICDFSYYQEGVRTLRARLGNLPCLVHSDDGDAARQVAALIPHSEVSSSGLTAGSALRSVSAGRGLVISNSSFGWWAALAARHSNVVAPLPWFASRKFDTRDLLLADWITQPRSYQQQGHRRGDA